jgi:hypothetical protein
MPSPTLYAHNKMAREEYKVCNHTAEKHPATHEGALEIKVSTRNITPAYKRLVENPFR